MFKLVLTKLTVRGKNLIFPLCHLTEKTHNWGSFCESHCRQLNQSMLVGSEDEVCVTEAHLISQKQGKRKASAWAVIAKKLHYAKIILMIFFYNLQSMLSFQWHNSSQHTGLVPFERPPLISSPALVLTGWAPTVTVTAISHILFIFGCFIALLCPHF